jgi:predicted phosphodiesterase
MERIAILADIHGNLAALEAVQRDLRQVAPDHIVVDGDVVNRGPQSKACLDAVRSAGWTVVMGNHEEYILKFAEGGLPDEWYSDWWLPTRRVAEQELDAEDIAYLQRLPLAHMVDVPGLPVIRVVHGSPRQLNEGIGPWMTDTQLLETVIDVPEPIVVGAHSHRPFDRQVGRRWFLNCGAVGAPFNGDPNAQYLVLTARDGRWKTDFRTLPYDHAPLYAAWDRTGYMERSVIAQVFRYEVQTATFHLQPYIQFCAKNGLERNDRASFDSYCHTARNTRPGRQYAGHPKCLR